MGESKWKDVIQIGSHRIGGGAPIYVVAEAGVNHNGDLAQALSLVSAAAAAGAQAVKFQAFGADRLVTADAEAAGYHKFHTQREMLARLELHPHDFAAIAAQCGADGIELLVTPFGLEDLAMVVDLGVPALKIASSDVTNTPLLKAAGRTHLPVILSTGAAAMGEIATALDTLTEAGTTEVVLLHCVSSYPTPLSEANLRCIGVLAEAFGAPVGYSDHTMEIVTGELAVQMGACLLEKHFTLDPEMDGPDHAMSLRPVELAAYVAGAGSVTRGELDEADLAEWELESLGNGVKRPRSIEADVRQVARSSVASAVAIPAGTTITAEMLTVKRPGGGMAPGEIESIPGRVAARDIPADTTLTADMLK